MFDLGMSWIIAHLRLGKRAEKILKWNALFLILLHRHLQLAKNREKLFGYLAMSTAWESWNLTGLSCLWVPLTFSWFSSFKWVHFAEAAGALIRNLLKYWVTPVKDMQEKCGCDESMGLGVWWAVRKAEWEDRNVLVPASVPVCVCSHVSTVQGMAESFSCCSSASANKIWELLGYQ